MRGHPLFGVALATAGVLLLTPDAMLMRLSGMAGFQMLGWRGLLMGAVLVSAWVLSSRHYRDDLARLGSFHGVMIILCQFFNAMLFCVGIAIAPVAVVLFGVATAPVFAAIFTWLLIGEPTRRATWITIAAVMGGIAVAVFGGHQGAGAVNMAALWGALAGLGVAAALALNFTVMRAQPQLPILLVIGVGALFAGVAGTLITGPGAMFDGTVWAMATTALVILPASFFSLSLASRHTHASNVSLLLLLETVLGPFWVWLVIGEAATPAMIMGGAIVVCSLAAYLLLSERRRALRRI